jgi:hypothetical protein
MRAGHGCGNGLPQGKPSTRENTANLHCSPACCTGIADMRSIAVIFLPCGATPDEVEAALRKKIESPECIEIPGAVRSEPIDDAEQLPLWRWFTS